MPDIRQRSEDKPIRVLSLDGGGMRGIVPATFLEKLEELSGRRISDLFDVCVGTSTGSILSVGLNVPGENSKARYSASDFVDMYTNLGATIFHEDRSLLKVLDGVTRPTYDPSGYEKVLHDYFGDTAMSELICEVAVPSIELQDMKMHVFSKSKAHKDSGQDFFVRQVIRAATAAPTFFPAADVVSIDSSTKGTFVDAGLSTNNPGLLAFAETKLIHAERPCIFVSMGTGAITKPIDAMRARNWGEVEWLTAIFNLQGDAQSSYTDSTLRLYHRFQVDLHQLPFEMDDTGKEHLAELCQAAQKYIQQNINEIDSLVSALVA
jgi:patatin-like phospholipase/acyl hydrolase